MSEPQVKCSEQISDHTFWFSHHQCPRNGKVERNGEWFCGQHDPEARRERQNKRSKKREEENAVSAARRNAPGLRIAELEAENKALREALGKIHEWLGESGWTFDVIQDLINEALADSKGDDDANTKERNHSDMLSKGGKNHEV